MPEGDTLRRAAEVITPVLEGQVVTELWFKKLRGYRPRVGDTIHSVDAVGKYLLIEFDRKLVLHTHLGMSGSWRATTLDTPVPKSPKLRIVIETSAGRALCFAAPDISTHISGSGTAPVDRLGPDLSNDDVDFAEVLAPPVTRQFFEPVARRNLEIIDPLSRIEMIKFSDCDIPKPYRAGP